jgi:hypothetical protein
MKLRTKGVLLAALFLLFASYASADVIWTLNNVAFNDGGVATGTFVLDTTGSFLSVNIDLSGGAYPAIHYSTSEPKFNTLTYVAFADTTFDRFTLLFISTPLTNAGGVVPLTGALDCINGPCRTGVSGELYGVQAPEPGTLMLLGSGLLGLVAVVRRRFV